MRIDVKKFLFLGRLDESDAFFAAAQNAGCIEFISPSPSKHPTSQEVEKAASALKILHHYPPKGQDPYDDPEEAEPVIEEILAFHSTLKKAQEEERTLAQEIERIAIFGDFDKEEILTLEKEGHCHFQFFYSAQEPTEEQEGLIPIGPAHGLHYFLAVNRARTTYPKMVEIYIEEPLGTLQKRLAEIKASQHAAEASLRALASTTSLLKAYLLEHFNSTALTYATTTTHEVAEGHLFATEGWVPTNHLEDLATLTSSFNIYCEEIAIGKEDRTPTHLENTGNARVGEELVHIYDTPSTRDKDPSLWVLIAFSFFFAMIVGDAGYGAVLLSTLLFFHHKFGKKIQGTSKRLLKLGLLLATCTLLWGTLTSSFFGISIATDNPIRKVSLVHWLAEKKAHYHLSHHDDVYTSWIAQIPELATAQNGREFLEKGGKISPEGTFTPLVLNRFSDNIMMEFALLAGALHIMCSFARYLDRNWSGLGWILFILGGYLFFPSVVGGTSMVHYLFNDDKAKAAAQGLFLVYTGIGLAMAIAVIQRKILGLLEIQNLIQVFADILSYLRLYALGLAGSIMSATFNDMAASAGWLAGTAILAVGHGINFTLGLMGGVIHGLRLNFLEWYHYSFEGGGKMWRPLIKKLSLSE